ncbi:SprT family zinc-dependent metalloprotease [Nevskia sp.]|uniref:M48 family metallopeptidase n=1 Tax=Nevskia sp. TaxID=1929292 RepID=UPI0025D49FEC|nr:SprT family zinc-dependent metalloprotease [Nevskia sp.]
MQTLNIGALSIEVTLKEVGNVHLSVHPPHGRVTMVAPLGTRLDVARAYAISKLGWIRAQQQRLLTQSRETPRRYITRETHLLWGRRYLLQVKELDAKPGVHHDHRRITLTVRPGTPPEKRAEIIHAWHKSLLHAAVPELIRHWEAVLGVKVRRHFLQRMKTRWGSCNAQAGHIRLNTELVKKPRDLVSYVVLHEMAHLIEPDHGERFVALLQQHYPAWREARAELNALPLSAETWPEQ